MRIAVIDTETTGADPEDEVVEAAVVLLERDGGPWRHGGEWSSMLRTSRPPCVEALATHHIRWEQSQALGRTWDEFVRGTPLELPIRGVTVLAAHNREFDRAFLERLDPRLAALPGICTWRCASHIWPDAPSHSNQALRYHLGLDVEPSGLPHRALADAQVTAALALRMLRERSAAHLIRLTQLPLLLRTVRFGKHRGEPWSEVPRRYLQWVLGQDFDVDVRHTAQYHLGKK